jgi:small subunit ribosomal protein S21
MKKIAKQPLEKSSIPAEIDANYFNPLQVKIFNNSGFERAMKTFRSMVQGEGILSLYKEKSSYEKPSDRKRRKKSEAIQRAYEEEMKQQKIISGEYEKEKQKKQAKKDQKIRQRVAAKSKEV